MQKNTDRYKIIPMTHSDENGMIINYECYNSIYGSIFVAATDKGICFIGIGNEKEMLEETKKRYGKAEFVNKGSELHNKAFSQITNPESNEDITFNIKGTDFQLAVWNELLRIEKGKTCSYKYIAEKIGKPKANRAVGTAIGQNPITFLIPCHRVIRSDGDLGGYYWGLYIKREILKNESVKL